MTASLDPDTPWTRFATRVAHWHPVITMATLIAIFVSAWVFPLTGARVAGVALILIFVATSYITGAHLHQLCSRCAARTPLDPDAAVRRHMWTLRYTHRATWVFMTIVIVMVVGLLAPVFFDGLWTAALYVLAMVTFYVDAAVGSYALMRHRVLQPWCPWCQRRWRRDDDHTPAPQPVPTGEGTR